MVQYLGGKTRLAKHIANAILMDTPNRKTYLEPMIGGGSVFATMAPHFEHAIGADIHPDLIMMYEALANGWVPPSTVTEEEYQALKKAEPSALRGFVGFGCSFGGRWFGGYARGKGRDFPAEAYRNALKQVPALEDRSFVCTSYNAFEPKEGAVVYLDPPYANTEPYSGTPKFDHELFWETARKWRDRGVLVYVSEFNAPEDFEVIWEKERKVGLGGLETAGYKTNIDRLYK